MSTPIYVPVPITSAEQAGALPEGTVVRWGTDGVGVVLGDGDVQVFGEGAERPVETLIRWTALVPVEVEVEHIRETGGRRREKTLYVTDWSTP